MRDSERLVQELIAGALDLPRTRLLGPRSLSLSFRHIQLEFSLTTLAPSILPIGAATIAVSMGNRLSGLFRRARETDATVCRKLRAGLPRFATSDVARATPARGGDLYVKRLLSCATV